MKTQKINKIQGKWAQGSVQNSARMDHLVKSLKYLCNREHDTEATN